MVDRAASGEGGAYNIATEGQYNSIRAAQWLIEQPVGKVGPITEVTTAVAFFEVYTRVS